jgi:hypothetical protein
MEKRRQDEEARRIAELQRLAEEQRARERELAAHQREAAAVGGRAWRRGLLARARAIGKTDFDPPPNPVDKDWSSRERSVRSPRLLQSDQSRPFEPGCWEH